MKSHFTPGQPVNNGQRVNTTDYLMRVFWPPQVFPTPPEFGTALRLWVAPSHSSELESEGSFRTTSFSQHLSETEIAEACILHKKEARVIALTKHHDPTQPILRNYLTPFTSRSADMMYIFYESQR